MGKAVVPGKHAATASPSARKADIVNKRLIIVLPCVLLLFIAQGLYGVQAGRPGGRVNSEEEAYGYRETYGQENRV